MLSLLIKSLAKEFYRQHAGMFLVGFYILFGVVEPSQLVGYQRALLLAGISSPLGMAIVFVCWVLYALKVYFFIRGKLALKEYSFLSDLGKLNRKNQIKLWNSLYVVMLLPIIIYLILMVGLSIYYGFFISLLAILVVFGTLLVGLTRLSYQTVTFKFSKKELTPGRPRRFFKKPFFSWPIFYLFKEQRLMLVMCKLLSIVFFKAMLWMFADLQKDTRVNLIAVFASVLCHAVLIASLLNFETQHLNWVKSMAISNSRRLINWLLVFVILLIPEWIFLVIAVNYNLWILLNGIVFGISILFLMLTLLYIFKLNSEHYLKGLLCLFFIGMWAIIAHQYLPFSILSLGCCSLYYLMMFRRTNLSAVSD